MATLQDITSSPYISFTIAAVGAALIALSFSKGDKKLFLVGLWLCADFMCDYVVTGFSEYWSSGDSTAYFYLYASTAVMFAHYALKNQEVYGRLLPCIFTVIAISSVIFCIYKYELLTNWNEWGGLLYNDMGSVIDGIYILFIVALEALMIILGFKDDILIRSNTRRINT